MQVVAARIIDRCLLILTAVILVAIGVTAAVVGVDAHWSIAATISAGVIFLPLRHLNVDWRSPTTWIITFALCAAQLLMLAMFPREVQRLPTLAFIPIGMVEGSIIFTFLSALRARY